MLKKYLVHVFVISSYLVLSPLTSYSQDNLDDDVEVMESNNRRSKKRKGERRKRREESRDVSIQSSTSNDLNYVLGYGFATAVTDFVSVGPYFGFAIGPNFEIGLSPSIEIARISAGGVSTTSKSFGLGIPVYYLKRGQYAGYAFGVAPSFTNAESVSSFGAVLSAMLLVQVSTRFEIMAGYTVALIKASDTTLLSFGFGSGSIRARFRF